MKNNIANILKKIGLPKEGTFQNGFYVIELEDSNTYAKVYTLLDERAINTEYPNFGTNTNKATVKVTNYFEVEEEGITYNIFLIADFKNGRYYVKIGEQ